MSTIVSSEKPTVRYPKDLIKLTYSKHAKARLVERTTGSLILAPNYIRLTPENTIDILSKNGRIVSCTVHIEYKRGVDMHLVIAVGTGVVKTVYFEKKHKTFEGYQKWVESPGVFVKDVFIKPAENYSKEIESDITFDEGEQKSNIREVRRETEVVEDVPRDMGREENWWKELFRAIRRILGGRTSNNILRSCPREGKREVEISEV